MNRDELILYFTPFVNRIVKKFNDDILDDDLVSEGMYTVIRVVDRHIKENGSMKPEDIEVRVYVWVRNSILDYKNKASNKQPNNIDIDIELCLGEDDKYDIIDKRWFNDKLLSVYELMLLGYDGVSICETLNISKRTYMRRRAEIKDILTLKLNINRTI